MPSLEVKRKEKKKWNNTNMSPQSVDEELIAIVDVFEREQINKDRGLRNCELIMRVHRSRPDSSWSMYEYWL